MATFKGPFARTALVCNFEFWRALLRVGVHCPGLSSSQQTKVVAFELKNWTIAIYNSNALMTLWALEEFC